MSDIYKQSGVDTKAGEHAVELMKDLILKTHQKQVIGNFGGFAGLFDISFVKNYQQPILATSTDGVGTKIKIAQLMDKHDTIGLDLVAMVLDDIVVCGAKPLFMTDYIAIGKVNPQKIAQIVSGIAQGCLVAGASLIGGETAEHPNMMKEDDYDIAGAGVGVVEASKQLIAKNIKAGDVVIGLKASGLHSNGYSLVRKIVFEDQKLDVNSKIAEFSHTLGEELLTPTAIYTKSCLSLIEKLNDNLHGLSHITGGGIAANLARVLPENLGAKLERNTWQIPVVIKVLAQMSKQKLVNFEQTLNMGIGMIAIVDKTVAQLAINILKDSQIDSFIIGEIIKKESDSVSDAPAKGGPGGFVNLVGEYN